MAAAGTAQTMGSMPQYPPQPASPTLTNPDMILPDYDDSQTSPDRSQSPMLMWQHSQSGPMQFDLSASSGYTGSASSGYTGPITPTTPIIYGNGTMLSDIGEVTEVESTCGGPGGRRASIVRDHGSAIRSNTNLPYHTIRRRERTAARERRVSIESTSTITSNHGRPAIGISEFDDSVSVADSSFQGDDEESVADSVIYQGSDGGDRTPTKTTTAQDLEQEMYSTALSRRAEQILANAKQRLTKMEGNLSRARTSLYSPSLYSMESGSTPSPTFRRPATAHPTTEPSKGAMGHSRIASEINMPTEQKHQVTDQRSSSALGVSGGYRPPYSRTRGPNSNGGHSSQHGIWGNPDAAKSQSSLHGHRRKHSLETLSEDGISNLPTPTDGQLNGATLDSFLSPTFGSYTDQGLKRSASTAQMRDLKDQMKDLKGRLSTLRDQARADSLKRRSLQSLRTPSPFTHARVEQWYVEPNAGYDDTVSIPSELGLQDTDTLSIPDRDSISGYNNEEENREAIMRGLAGAGYGMQGGEEKSPEVVEQSTFEPNILARPDEQEVAETEYQDDEDDMRTEDGFQEEEEAVEDEVYDDAYSESGESLYVDTVEHAVSHEDREDAFDYEHFFLHSAMGRLGSRNSRDSFSSDDSTETTRAPMTPTSARTSVIRNRPRRGSVDSVSTSDSFETATEGRHTRASTSVDKYESHHKIVSPIPGNRNSRGDGSLTPEAARRATFGPSILTHSDSQHSSSSSGRSSSSMGGNRRNSAKVAAMPRSLSSAATSLHRPSVSSMSSTGTSRSFPLVNRPKSGNGSSESANNSCGILTPPTTRDSPDFNQHRQKQMAAGLQRVSESLMNDAASICESLSELQDGADDQGQPDEGTGMGVLPNRDQLMVQQLVATIGKCVLGLSEKSADSNEAHDIRNRIKMARLILEGADLTRAPSQ